MDYQIPIDPIGAVQVTTPPSSEPISLAEAKAHLRVDTADEDPLIQNLIAAAREACEEWCGRSFVTQTLTLTLDRFPSPSLTAPGPETAWSGSFRNDGTIELPRPPAISLTSITYIDTNGASQTLSSSGYKLDLASQPARLAPAFGTSWPATRDEIASVVIVYSAGYGAASAVPARAKAAILLLLGTLYENREDAVVGSIVSRLPLGVMDLLGSIRVPSLP